MKVIKRSGKEVKFNIQNIINAISRANTNVEEVNRISDEEILEISKNVQNICKSMKRAMSVEEIQDLVEDQLMEKKAFDLARKYITYRYSIFNRM